MFALIVYTLSVYALGCATFYRPKSESPKHSEMSSELSSELSNPSINIPPVGFGRPHIQILEVLYKNDPYEVTRKHINLTLGKSRYHAYERQLWLWGYVKRRVQKTIEGRTHFYTLTSSGKDALLRFNNKF